MKEIDVQILISTSKINLEVNERTGEILFLYKNERELSIEKIGGGKIISKANVLGEKTFHIRQLFESNKDEGFFGLGAHQNGVWNYKGHNIDLCQHNIVDIVPFIVSSYNYGILWDNNSNTKFGDVRDYSSLSELSLYAKDGSGGGLTVEYFKDQNFDSLFTSQKESRIEHEYIDVDDPYPTGFQNNVKADRWSREIASSIFGFQHFQLYCSSYTKLWLCFYETTSFRYLKLSNSVLLLIRVINQLSFITRALSSYLKLNSVNDFTLFT